MSRLRFSSIALLLAVCGWVSACSDTPQGTPAKPSSPNFEPGDAGAVPDTAAEDLGEDNDDAGDVSEDMVSDLPRPEPGSRVEVDLSGFVSGAPDPQNSVRLFQAAQAADLLQGDVAQGRLGDWVFENDHVRMVIEGDDRAIGPCPWGGNVLDVGVRKSPEQAWSKDSAGEICLLFNIGRTLKPDRFEVLADGADGEAAVLAVTGHLELLDFIDVIGMSVGRIGDLELNLPLDPDAELPLTLTVYYIMRPGDQGLRVVTAFRNDGDATELIATSHLMNSGGTVDLFNPINESKGFGSKSLSADNLQSTPLPFLSFLGAESGMTYMPDAIEGLQERRNTKLPISGSYVSISGVSVSWIGATDILVALLSTPAQLARLPGITTLEPGQSAQISMWQLAGDGSLATMVDVAYEHLGIETTRLQGQAMTMADDPDQTLVEGALISAVDADGATMNQVRIGTEPGWSMELPPGEYTLRGLWEGRLIESAPFMVEGDMPVDGPPMVFPAPGRLQVTINTPDGEAVTGRVTVACVDGCPEAPNVQLKDTERDKPGRSGNFHIGYVGVDGVLEMPLAPGSYRVAVSRGIEWSVWPPNAVTDNGMLITITQGETLEVVAEIAPVINTTGVLSGDFHVHSVSSPDSAVPRRKRVLSFLAEGVDVLVSTDHDVVSDLGPDIEALGAGALMHNIIGVELTTSSYGHYNAFPMVHDPDSRNGGALDWAKGADFGMTPEEIFMGLREAPGQQVIQINHPEDSGTIGALKADPLRGQTFARREDLRMPPGPVDEATGDTLLWSDMFTAMEIMNGFGTRSLWQRWRWWLQMIGRGFAPTGTAVTDTHKAESEINGTPRTYVWMPDGEDNVASLDADVFAQQVNSLRAIGTNGPFFEVVARNAQDEEARPGDTLTVGGEDVRVQVRYQLPAWLEVNRLDIYTNLRDDILTDTPGEASSDEVPPTMSIPVSMDDATLETVAEGTQLHQRRVGTVDLTMTFAEDAYLIVVLRGVGGGIPAMYPAVFSRSVKPFSFSNPLFLDADGGGYDHPPLMDLARTNPKRAVAPRPLPAKTVDAKREALKRLIDNTVHEHH